MSTREIELEIEGVSGRVANELARELAQEIRRRAEPGLNTEIRKADMDTQDAGSVLAVIFGSGMAIALAEGVRAFLAKRGSKIWIVRDGARVEVLATGDGVKDLDVTKTVAQIERLAK